MSITVRDCLKLPSLRNAEVLAGHAGLDQYVSTVSVLEYAKTFAMANPLFLGNEIILTAFISIKDDVDAQCEAIRRLHAVGEAAIVLYYVDYYMENVDQKLVQVANDLDFPLIVMPRNDYSLRYKRSFSEVFAQKRGAGKISLRRSQWQLAAKNASMAIWLGKQYLGQRDIVELGLPTDNTQDDALSVSLREMAEGLESDG